MLLVSLALTLALHVTGSSSPTASPAPQFGVQAHSQGQTKTLKIANIEPQKGTAWCWAPCIQSALGYYGLKVKQEQVVAATYGMLVDRPLNTPMMVMNLLKAGNLSPTKAVHPFRAAGAPAPAALVHEIAVEKSPVIVLYRATPQMGHFVICYGVTYAGTKEFPIIQKVHILDPADGKRKEWPAAQLASLWQESVYLRVAPKPPLAFQMKGGSYQVTPTFDVISPYRVEGRIWYSNAKKKWEVFNLMGVSQGFLD